MPTDVKITELPSASAVNDTDLFVVVDVTSTPTTKKVTAALVAAAAPVQSVAGRQGDVTLAVADISGLQTELDGKQSSGSYVVTTDSRLTDARDPLAHTHSISNITNLQTTLDGKQASGSYAATSHGHSISDVTGLQTALDGKQASGSYATLVDGTVPSAQLPSYVDDVLEYAAVVDFPATGEAGKIYVATGSGKIHRWSGSTYIEISPSPGSTDSVTEGSTNLYYTNVRAAAAAPVQSVAGRTGAVTLAKGDVGLGSVDNTADSAKPVSTATQTALDGKAATSHGHSVSDVTGLQTALDGKANIDSPTFTGTVGGLTKTMVGLGNVDNTSDASKPVSTAQQTALDAKAAYQTPVFALGAVSGSTAINYNTDRQLQTLSLAGTATTFTAGTGWPSAGLSVDVVLLITVTSATTITWSVVNDWYTQPAAGALAAGTHIFLLRAVGTTIQGHYIGSKTN